MPFSSTMRPESQPQQFTARSKDGEVFQSIAVSPVTGGGGLTSLAVVAESNSRDNPFYGEILLLRPCYGGFMVREVIARVYAKVTKLMWDNVTWVGLGRQVKTVSCLVAATEHDVTVGEVSEGGLSGVCRARFRAPARDCVFLAWVPRVVYVTGNGAGAIDFSFEAQITVTRHTYSPFLHQDKEASDTSQGNHVTAAALTCLGVLDQRSEVLVGDNTGLIYVYRTDTSRFSKHRQMTFSFPLTQIAVYASRTSLFLAGVSDQSHASQDSPTAGILRLDRTNLTASPEYQPLGQGRVLGVSWCLDPLPLLTIIEENTGLVHHKAQYAEAPVMGFAAKPVTRVSKVAWGSGGWLGYVMGDEVVLEREPAILATPDE